MAEPNTIEIQEPNTSQPISPDTLEKIINRRDPAEDLMHALKGIVLDRKGIRIHKGDPLMNDLGINSIVQFLYGTLSQNVVLTTMTEDEIFKLTEQLGSALLTDLRLHAIEYGVRDGPTLSKISWICFTNIRAALNSAQYGFTLEHVTPIYRKVETQPKEQRASFLPFFGGR